METGPIFLGLFVVMINQSMPCHAMPCDHLDGIPGCQLVLVPSALCSSFFHLQKTGESVVSIPGQ